MNKANTSNRVTLIAECAILQLSASAASGTYRDPWDFVVRAKNSLKNRESFQNCELLVGAHRIELWTSFLSGKRSTTELRAQLLTCYVNQLGIYLPSADLPLASQITIVSGGISQVLRLEVLTTRPTINLSNDIVTVLG